MSKLHQHLAVESEIKQKAEKVLKETIKTFQNKSSHFDGLIQTYKPFDESQNDVIEENKALVDTVINKLLYNQLSIIQLFDFIANKERTTVRQLVSLI